jgi:magnesium-protoporphyrin O-methyltransferase
MSCCTPSGYRTVFGADAAERDARRYRRKGLAGSARWLLERLLATGLAGRSVLEIGGGAGGLQVELIRAGADRATNVEIVDAYEGAARTLIAERGLGERIERRVGDIAVRGADAPTADIVVLHRVLCCYPDASALMAAACEHSRDRVAVTVPRESWWVKLGFAAENTWFRARRIGFRAYVHPIAPMLDVAAANGFRAAGVHRGRLWASIILTRFAGSPEQAPAGG